MGGGAALTALSISESCLLLDSGDPVAQRRFLPKVLPGHRNQLIFWLGTRPRRQRMPQKCYALYGRWLLILRPRLLYVRQTSCLCAMEDKTGIVLFPGSVCRN